MKKENSKEKARKFQLNIFSLELQFSIIACILPNQFVTKGQQYANIHMYDILFITTEKVH